MKMERIMTDDTKLESGRYIIKKHGTDKYWSCSIEGGIGWQPKKPKQSFSKSELLKQIYRMGQLEYMPTIEIHKLRKKITEGVR